MKKILIITLLALAFNCNSIAQKKELGKAENFEVFKSDAEWKTQLTDLEYYVLREEGTEPAFSSDLNNNYSKGTYLCAACKTPLFKSEHKFDSGTGWPSFDREIQGNIAYTKEGASAFYGIEEHCATCGGHLGHVFTDGPRETTGKRHCINGVALDFVPDK